MSHVVTIDVTITDLEALKDACNDLGFQFHKNQKTFKWWGHHVGDYPLPEGFNVEDMGKCEHAISIPGAEYEIGIVKKRDNSKSYTFMFDFYRGGRGLIERIGGNKASKIVQMYSVYKAMRELKRKGYRTSKNKHEDGTIEINAMVM